MKSLLFSAPYLFLAQESDYEPARNAPGPVFWICYFAVIILLTPVLLAIVRRIRREPASAIRIALAIATIMVFSAAHITRYTLIARRLSTPGCRSVIQARRLSFATPRPHAGWPTEPSAVPGATGPCRTAPRVPLRRLGPTPCVPCARDPPAPHPKPGRSPPSPG